jgi:hypothetical protein
MNMTWSYFNSIQTLWEAIPFGEVLHAESVSLLGYCGEQQSVNEQNQQIFPVIDLNKEGTSVSNLLSACQTCLLCLDLSYPRKMNTSLLLKIVHTKIAKP